MEIISREDAIKIGQAWFFSGVPCKNGHIDKKGTKRWNCYQCTRELSKIRRQKNKEKISEQKKAYYRRNAEKINKKAKDNYPNVKEERQSYLKEYYQKNKEKLKEKSSEYFKENKEKVYKYKKLWNKTDNGIINKKRNKANRRDREREGNIKAADIKELIKNSKDVCYWCNSKLNKKDSSAFHLDHYVPLSKGGLNSIENIVISCPSCNMNKKAKDPYEFAISRGRLL